MIMTEKERSRMLHLIAIRREEIKQAPHPSKYKDEWIRLIRLELDLITSIGKEVKKND